MQIYNRTAKGVVASAYSASFKGSFGCITGGNQMADLSSSPDLYTALYPYVSTCPLACTSPTTLA